jgi:hypothetical protein
MLRFLLIVITVYLLLKYVIKPLLRVLLRRYVQNMVEKNFGNPNNMQQKQYRERKKDGSISVDYIPENKKNKPGKDNDNGEYIDYEEIK